MQGKQRTDEGTGGRFRRVSLLALLVVLVGTLVAFAVAYRSWVDAQARAIVVISSLPFIVVVITSSILASLWKTRDTTPGS